MKRNVCFITASPSTVDAFLKNHIAELSKKSAVTVVTDLSSGKLDISEAVHQKNIYISRKISFFTDIKSLFLLFIFLYQGKFDLVVSVTPKAGLLGMIASLLCRVPVRLHWFTGQVWVTKQGVFRWILKMCDKAIALTATHLLADSGSQMRFLLEEKVADTTKVDVILQGSISGVNLNRFSRKYDVRRMIRSEMNLKHSDVVFLFLGRLTRDKGVLDLAAAFSELSKELSGIKLAFVGPDEDGIVDDIKGVCASCIEQVYFGGFTDTPESYLSAADVFVLPSYREGFGTSVIEAAAASVPCIGSRIYGLTDAIKDKVTGILFEPRSTDQLTSAMKQLAQSKDERYIMGTNARNRVVEQFSSDKVTAALINYIEKIS